MITRIAPTPSGYIHAGNIYNFLLNWLWARSNGGKVVLRIDDGDAERKRKEYVEDIFRVLNWLGLNWDIGPESPGDFEKNWSQRHRTNLYTDLLNELAGKNMLFACTCSRKQQCNCIDKNIPLTNTGVAWKIKITNDNLVSFDDKIMGNVKTGMSSTGPFVVKRKDGFASYQVCSLADDRHFRITHICRGSDLQESTAMQLYINKQLGSPWLHNCSFWHHHLLNGEKGSKLSKSAGALSSSVIHTMQKEEMLSLFASWMGWKNNGTFTLNEMLGRKEFISELL